MVSMFIIQMTFNVDVPTNICIYGVIFRRDKCTKISTHINDNLLITTLQNIVTINLTYSKQTIGLHGL